MIARIFEEAGLPKGVLHVLPGGAEAGEAICTDPDIAMVSFTGSSGVGRRIGELAGKHLILKAAVGAEFGFRLRAASIPGCVSLVSDAEERARDGL